MWSGLSFAPLFPSSPRSIDGMPVITRPGPHTTGIYHVGYVIDVPPPLPPRGARIRASPPSALVPSGPHGIDLPVCLQGSGFSKAYAPGGRIFLPPYELSTPGIPWRSSCLPSPQGVFKCSPSILTFLVVMVRST